MGKIETRERVKYVRLSGLLTLRDLFQFKFPIEISQPCSDQRELFSLLSLMHLSPRQLWAFWLTATLTKCWLLPEMAGMNILQLNNNIYQRSADYRIFNWESVGYCLVWSWVLVIFMLTKLYCNELEEYPPMAIIFDIFIGEQSNRASHFIAYKTSTTTL